MSHRFLTSTERPVPLTDLFIWRNFWTLAADGLAVGAIYALVALGYTLVYGVLRLINFAHSEVFMLGTFGTLFALEWLGYSPDKPVVGFGSFIVAAFVGLVVAVVVSGSAAVILELVAYRPLRRRGAPRLAALISAIGASLVIAEGMALWRGRDLERMATLLKPTTAFTLFDAEVTTTQVLIITAAVLMMISLDQFVSRTRVGRGIRAVAQDAETATLMGVNIDRVISLTFLLGGIMAGGAAMLYMTRYEVTKFDIGFLFGVKAFTAAVLGGIGNLRGALIGGLVLGLIETFGSGALGSQWRDVIAFVVLVVVLMFRPTGLLGESLGRARA